MQWEDIPLEQLQRYANHRPADLAILLDHRLQPHRMFSIGAVAVADTCGFLASVDIDQLALTRTGRRLRLFRMC